MIIADSQRKTVLSHEVWLILSILFAVANKGHEEVAAEYELGYGMDAGEDGIAEPVQHLNHEAL